MAQALVTLNSNHITNMPEVVNAAAVAALTGPQDVPERRSAPNSSQARPGDGHLRAIPGVSLPASAGRVLRVPGHQLRVRQAHNGRC
jgi:aspartate aminotransferase